MSGLVWSLQESSVAQPEQWLRPRTLAEQLPQGRLSEITAQQPRGQMTTAVACLVHAQQRGETTAWVQLAGGTLYPPDLAQCGVDLDALIVVQAPRTSGARGIGKAAELLVRSGGFGFVVLDLVGQTQRHDLVFQGRLLGLAREHSCTIVLLTDAQAHGSFGPLVSVCVEPKRVRVGASRFSLEHVVRKDKLGLFSGRAPSPEPELEL